MNAKLNDGVVFKIQEISATPCARGISRILESLLGELEDYIKSNPKIHSKYQKKRRA